MIKLSHNVFDEYLVALGPWTRKKWVACVQRWAKNKLRPIDDKYLQEAVKIEFEPYYDDPDPYKLAFGYFHEWIESLNEKIAFLQGNRPWHPGLESVGGCFVKKLRTEEQVSYKASSGFFWVEDGNVKVTREDEENEIFQNIYEMVLTGQWVAD